MAIEIHPHASPEKEKPTFSLALVLSAALTLAVLGGLILIERRGGLSRSPSSESLPFGAKEQAYASKILLGELEMSRATNLAKQDVTYLSGRVANQGDQTVREIQTTVEYRDALGQVVLREQRRVLGTRATPLAPGESRNFQIPFDNVPASWNLHIPSVRISGMDLP